jgi:hypothetical protein
MVENWSSVDSRPENAETATEGAKRRLVHVS